MRIEKIPAFRMTSSGLDDDLESLSSLGDELSVCGDPSSPEQSIFHQHQIRHRSSSAPAQTRAKGKGVAQEDWQENRNILQPSISANFEEIHKQQHQLRLVTNSVRRYSKTMHAFTVAQFEHQTRRSTIRGPRGSLCKTELISPLCLNFSGLQMDEGEIDSPTLGSAQVAMKKSVEDGKTGRPPRSVGSSAGRNRLGTAHVSPALDGRMRPTRKYE
jgi:hypothetical protein